MLPWALSSHQGVCHYAGRVYGIWHYMVGQKLLSTILGRTVVTIATDDAILTYNRKMKEIEGK